MSENLKQFKIDYFQDGGISRKLPSGLIDPALRNMGYYLPGISTYLTVQDFVLHPSLNTGVNVALSLIPTVAGATAGVVGIGKAIKSTKKLVKRPNIQISPEVPVTSRIDLKVKRNTTKISNEPINLKYYTVGAIEPGSTPLVTSGVTPLTGDLALQAFAKRIELTKGLTREEKDILMFNLNHPIRTNNFDDVVDLIRLKEYPGDPRTALANSWARDRMKTLYLGKIENVVLKHPDWFTDLALGFSGLFGTEGMTYDLILKAGGLSRMRVVMADPAQKNLAMELNNQGSIKNSGYYQAHYSPANKHYQFKEALAHEVAHLRDVLYKAKGMRFPNPQDWGINVSNMGKYYKMYDSTEILARGTLIKNALGISDKVTKITGIQLRDLALRWTTSGFKDNGMTKLFNNITDWDKAAEYFSRYSLALGIPLVTSIALFSNENTSQNLQS